MRWSLKLAKVSGIAIYVHWTFLLLIAYIVWATYRPDLPTGQAVAQSAWAVGLILAVFLCVVLHELGHSLTAKRFGIATRQITLLPIGGVASLERMPEDPKQELWITVMGPLVNVVIAGVLLVVLLVTGGLRSGGGVMAVGGQGGLEATFATGQHFIAQLMVVNMLLVVFNLIPAFPMDGGRILRAILAMAMNYARATAIAARVGQFMAILFAAAALFLGMSPFLFIIAIFIFLGAEAESQYAAMRVAFQGLTVRDAMMTRYRVLHPEDSLRRAADELLAGSQEDFPVVAQNGEAGGEAGMVLGMLPRGVLLRALANGGLEATVGESMIRGCPVASEGDPVEVAYRRMRELDCGALPVVRDGRLVGLVSLGNISELVMVRSALEGSPDRAVTG